jgi:protein SCO1/2
VRSLVVVVAAVVALSGSCRAHDDAWRSEVAAWHAGDPLPPDLPLVDETGTPFHLRDLVSNQWLLGFAFTHCAVPSACPLTMTKLVDLERRGIGPIVVVTLDPERDTPAVLHDYGAQYGIDPSTFHLATGDKDAVDALASLINVVSIDGAHPVKLAHIGRTLRVLHVYSDNNFTFEDIAHAPAAE